MDRLPSAPEAYPRDLDATRLWHEAGHPQGVALGYPKRGLKPGWHPLRAVLAEVRVGAQRWLRPGNASFGSNAAAFFLDLGGNLPRPRRLRGVRAEAGFCLPELLALWDQVRLPCVVVVQLSPPMQKLSKGDLPWTATAVPGTEVAAVECQSLNGPPPCRLGLLRRRGHEPEDTRVGQRRLDVPGYRIQALVTSRPTAPHPPRAVWRCDNGRADGENAIKELREEVALPKWCWEKFWVRAAALTWRP